MFLIVAFSFGLASVLIAIGILAHMPAGFRPLRRQQRNGPRPAGNFGGRRHGYRNRHSIQSLSGTTLLASTMPLGSGALFVLGLGLVLGLEHATDADHIVAVTTFVSEQRSILRSCSIGALWGLGSYIISRTRRGYRDRTADRHL